jgi:DNA-binding NarL/FixJ family response regulator
MLANAVSSAASMDASDLTPSDLRVAVVAADPLARAGLATLLAELPNLSVVLQLGLDENPERPLAASHAEVVLIDLGWEHEAESAALAAWLEQGLPALLLIPDDRPSGQLWSLGAAGVLSRGRLPHTIADALWTIRQGLLVLDPDMGRPALADPGAGAGKGLTPREAEVLQLLAEGQTNRAIAQSLRISEHTVKFHVTAILGKLGAESRTEAVVQAARAGWIVL